MRTDVASPRPLLVAHLLGPLDDELVRLLDSLTDQEWDAPTIAPGWCVSDVAAHLLDTSLRKLAVCRDGCTLRVAGHDPACDIAAFVNRLNADGVRFFRALPRRQLIELIGAASRASAAFHSSLDPFASATFAVTWAGETASANWFDTARELTERWHHQQQIRLAVHRHGAMQAEYYHPVLDCFMRGLPHWYRAIEADDDTLVEVSVDGEGGGSWYLLRDEGTWRWSRHARACSARRRGSLPRSHGGSSRRGSTGPRLRPASTSTATASWVRTSCHTPPSSADRSRPGRPDRTTRVEIVRGVRPWLPPSDAAPAGTVPTAPPQGTGRSQTCSTARTDR